MKAIKTCDQSRQAVLLLTVVKNLYASLYEQANSSDVTLLIQSEVSRLEEKIQQKTV